MLLPETFTECNPLFGFSRVFYANHQNFHITTVRDTDTWVKIPINSTNQKNKHMGLGECMCFENILKIDFSILKNQREIFLILYMFISWYSDRLYELSVKLCINRCNKLQPRIIRWETSLLTRFIQRQWLCGKEEDMANNGPSKMLGCNDGMDKPADCGTLTDGCWIELPERGGDEYISC